MDRTERDTHTERERKRGRECDGVTDKEELCGLLQAKEVARHQGERTLWFGCSARLDAAQGEHPGGSLVSLDDFAFSQTSGGSESLKPSVKEPD